MSKTALQNTLAVTLERIQSLMSELRQTESLAAQIHEMVVMKRHRLDSLMSEYVEMAAVPEVAVAPPVVEEVKMQVFAAPVAAAPLVAAPLVAAPLAAAPLVAAPIVAAPSAPAVEDLPMSSHGNYGAPKDLLQGRQAPSAQHVLDSLNRLMVGIKDISSKQATAA
jgi:hypothetical protein